MYDRLPEPIDLKIDHAKRTLYWTDRGDPPLGDTVNRAPLDASANGRPAARWRIGGDTEEPMRSGMAHVVRDEALLNTWPLNTRPADASPDAAPQWLGQETTTRSIAR
jgi:hypothetical protein